MNVNGATMYCVEKCEGEKSVHILAYVWDCGDGSKMPWRITEYSFLYVPIEEFAKGFKERGYDYLSELQGEVKQYESDCTESEAKNSFEGYFDGECGKHLQLSDISAETPIGDYYDLEN